MSDRISIPALREYASGPAKIGTYTAMLPRHDLLALVEAVEATEERLETIYESRDPERMTQEAYFGLQYLRARFDFGEEA